MFLFIILSSESLMARFRLSYFSPNYGLYIPALLLVWFFYWMPPDSMNFAFFEFWIFLYFYK